MTGWGSWQWVGEDLASELDSGDVTFDGWEQPKGDVAVIVKHRPPLEWAALVARRIPLVYCPIDSYGSAEEIAQDSAFLSLCARIIVHCQRLQGYFDRFAKTVYLDHHIKYATPLRRNYVARGNILWVGVRSNLPALVSWVNANPLSVPLDVVTNVEDPSAPFDPSAFGFRKGSEVQIHNWTPELQLRMTGAARAAIDIKDTDFRSQHKPTAKAIDFIASGVPVALNVGSSPSEYLASLGLTVAAPSDIDRWLSREYWEEIRTFGRTLRRSLSLKRVAHRMKKIVSEAILDQTCHSVTVSIEKSATDIIDFPAVSNIEEGNARSSSIGEAPNSANHEQLLRGCQLAVSGYQDEARRVFNELDVNATDAPSRALAASNLAAIFAAEGNLEAARKGFLASLAHDPHCNAAKRNLAVLDAEIGLKPIERTGPGTLEPQQRPVERRIRVAIVSFLFNWPSSGGGIVHTVELAHFLKEAGYEVCHFFVRYDAWGIGAVTEPLPVAARCLEFDATSWNVPVIQRGLRESVQEYEPDYVILTDSWNFKPLLAEAVREFPYILRLQALECLCPLNNVRLLPEPDGRVSQCRYQQLASPEQCSQCVGHRGHFSGSLHKAERALSGVGTSQYNEKLTRAFSEAESVLVVNPLVEAMVSPFAKDVRVVTAGMDPGRFPWPPPNRPIQDGKTRILFAGVVQERMKGFHILHEACELLRKKRQDFELMVTADPPGRVDAFTVNLGWQTQGSLPAALWNCDILAMPTVAQEALGRTAVEAMAAGRPVVASRIGGLPFTVVGGLTGLLADPGSATDLAQKLTLLIDDVALRHSMGLAGRRRFEEHYSWPVIIERHYRPLLCKRRKTN